MADNTHDPSGKSRLPLAAAAAAGAAVLAGAGWMMYSRHKAQSPQQQQQRTENPMTTRPQPTPEALIANLERGYDELKTGQNAGEVPGFNQVAGYPGDFQADYFPVLAGPGGTATIMGPNMAHYFSRTERDAQGAAVRVVEDTSHMKILLGNVVDQVQASQVRASGESPDTSTQFTMLIDADAMDESKRASFAGKYLRCRQDSGAEWAQPKENDIMRAYINRGGLREDLKEVIREKAEARNGVVMPEYAADALADRILKHNFFVKTVDTGEGRMEKSSWRVEGPQGELHAAQLLADNTRALDRPWDMGTQPELQEVAKRQDKKGAAARELESTVETMMEMAQSATLVSDRNPQAQIRQAGGVRIR